MFFGDLPEFLADWRRGPGREAAQCADCTADGKNAAHYENTILITDGDPELLTDASDSLV